jgi:hypothetical protein
MAQVEQQMIENDYSLKLAKVKQTTLNEHLHMLNGAIEMLHKLQPMLESSFVSREK